VGDVLEGPVLQQAREQQVAGLDEGEVLLVLRAGLRQQPGRLEVEQGRGDEEELGGLRQVPPVGLARSALMWAMNSSVTLARAISVMSSLCLAIRPSSRSKGPEVVEVRPRRPSPEPGG
jgi:hypothetical protein